MVERLVDRLLIIKDGNVSEFFGDIHDYRKLILSNNIKKKKQKSVLKNKKSNVSIPNFSLSDLKKSLSYSEKKILEFEKEKKTLEIEMLNQNFYSYNNQKRAQEVNFNLQKVLMQIAEEEKVWEKIVESIELISK